MGINYHQIKIKNADLFVIMDDQGYQFIMKDEQMLTLNLAENLRLHSSGCIFFKKQLNYHLLITELPLFTFINY
jgi:hypothetical protein